MRPVLHADVVAAARALYGLSGCDRVAMLQRWILSAELADRFRQRAGRSHAAFGDGSLELAVMGQRKPPEPLLSDADYCDCLVMVLEALIAQNALTAGAGHAADDGRVEV